MARGKFLRGTKWFWGSMPNKHEDPLWQSVDPGTRRCPFDINGFRREELTHYAFDFVPERWLATDSAEFVEHGLKPTERKGLIQLFGFGSHVCTARALVLAEELHIMFARSYRSMMWRC